MKRTLSIYANVASTGGTLLLEVAMGLREYRLRPEALVWSLVGPDKVKLWFIVEPDREHHLPPLSDRFGQIEGVTKVEIEDPPTLSALPVITD